VAETAVFADDVEDSHQRTHILPVIQAVQACKEEWRVQFQNHTRVFSSHESHEQAHSSSALLRLEMLMS
jgi:hypothetical protein